MIFKLVHAADWVLAERDGRFEGSTHDRQDGFLHFSTASQLVETLARYYAGTDDLLLIAVDEVELGPVLTWESSASRGENFPHLYGPLLVSAVRWKHRLARDAEGQHVVPAIAFASS